jgi:quercetin dioxygenase-like cupin family protein
VTPEAEAINLADYVEYAADAIVSKVLVDKKAGTLTLFAFDEGQNLSEHSTPFDALVQVLDGEAELVIGGRPVRAVAGQVVIMPANVPHSVRAVRKFKMLLTMIRS